MINKETCFRRMDTWMDTFIKSVIDGTCNSLKRKMPPARIELATPGLGNLCSIRLS